MFSLIRQSLKGIRFDRRLRRMFCTLIVVASAVTSFVYAGSDISLAYWLSSNSGTLILASLALLVTLLRLSDMQRLVGLAAVTLVGAWWAFLSARGLITGASATAAGIPLMSTLLMMAACYAAQVRRRQNNSRHGASADA